MITSTLDLSHLEVLSPQSFGGLTLFPVRGPGDRSPDYVTLDEALASGSVAIGEIGAQGAVPHLKLRNDGFSPVLVIDGEELVGGKQNRVLNVTILAAAKSEVALPVSCVERGRWSWRSYSFSTSPRVQYARGRAEKVASVTRSMEHFGTRVADQGAVWADIDRKMHRMRAHSPTAAMADLYDRSRERTDEYVEALRLPETAQGAVFALDGRVGLCRREAAPSWPGRRAWRSVHVHGPGRDQQGNHRAPNGQAEHHEHATIRQRSPHPALEPPTHFVRRFRAIRRGYRGRVRLSGQLRPDHQTLQGGTWPHGRAPVLSRLRGRGRAPGRIR
jgi:hypothetical protein